MQSKRGADVEQQRERSVSMETSSPSGRGKTTALAGRRRSDERWSGTTHARRADEEAYPIPHTHNIRSACACLEGARAVPLTYG